MLSRLFLIIMAQTVSLNPTVHESVEIPAIGGQSHHCTSKRVVRILPPRKEVLVTTIGHLSEWCDGSQQKL
jgi:hypothetical protein